MKCFDEIRKTHSMVFSIKTKAIPLFCGFRCIKVKDIRKSHSAIFLFHAYKGDLFNFLFNEKARAYLMNKFELLRIRYGSRKKVQKCIQKLFLSATSKMTHTCIGRTSSGIDRSLARTRGDRCTCPCCADNPRGGPAAPYPRTWIRWW